MPDSPIVSADWLDAHLGDRDLAVVEVSALPTRDAYDAGHIPGAQWCFWKDWCWHATDRQMITPAAMAARLGAAGIGPDTKLVFYGDPVQFGTYAYWAFSMAGHKPLHVLDGGRKKWLADGRKLSTDTPAPTPVDYPIPPLGDTSMRVGRDDVLAHLHDEGRVLIDARSPEEYEGRRVMPEPGFDHGAERKGRIPGARHLYYMDLLNDDESFKSPEAMLAEFEKISASSGQTKEAVAYCRLSHRATLVWMAATYLLGWEHVKIYDGSWTEWGSIVGVPVEP